MERQLLGEAMRRTKATLIYRRTKNLRPCSCGGPLQAGDDCALPRVELDDALEISEQTEI